MMKTRILQQVLALCLAVTGPVASGVTQPPRTYRAGIVEFKPSAPANSKKESILKNAELYARYAADAAEMGVQILVFPEYGLTTLDDLGDRENVADFLQDVPDPKLQQWNPCEDPDKFNNTQVLHELSCAASQNSLVIVANLLSREPCPLGQANATSQCPEDGHFQFNTNVIFAKNGTLLARYHKYHLFLENNRLDAPPQPEYVIVDLGFVRIATFTGFDMLFDRPAVELVEKHGVRNIAFPTAWVNELPFLTSPQIFSSISYGLGINLLAANYHKPQMGSLGSGIFSSSQGVLNGTWDISTPGRLVIADVPVNPINVTLDDKSLSCDVAKSPESDDLTSDEAGIPPFVMTNNPSMKRVNKTHRITYQALSKFAHADIKEMQGNITNLCQGSLCCNLTYRFVARDNNDTYKFVVRSGVRTAYNGGRLGTQICSVLRCETADDIESCGRMPDPSHTPGTSFAKLTITGSFRTKYLYPSVFSTNLGLVNTHRWLFTKRICGEDSDNGPHSYTVSKLNFTTAIERSILEASILGRVYEWDRQ